jgi:hypothetical protein
MGICRGCGQQLGTGILSCPHCGATGILATSFSTSQPIYPPGTVLADRYRIEKLLGTGASGAVYGVTDTRLNRRLALKILWEPCLPDDPSFERSRREALAGQKAQSPHLVMIHDLLHLDGHAVIVMDWVEGETLRQRLAREGALPWPKACPIAAEILQGLQVLHSLGIVHRDVKCGNILLDAEGTAKLGDLGLAKGSDLGQTLTADATVLGTPGYIAPEILQGNRATPASDLYSVGVVLFEMLAGAAPFGGASAHETLARALSEPPPLHLLRQKKAPRWLVRLVSRLLEKDPKDRYPSAQSVLDALERHTAGFSIARRWRKRGLAAALLLAVIGGALWAWKPWEETKVAASLKIVGESVEGLSKDGKTLWSVRLTGPISAAEELDKDPAHANRFVVVHGGYPPTKAPWKGRPRFTILSAKGETLSQFDPLEKFNPYKDDFREEFFSGKLYLVGDFNRDGYQDAILSCLHNYYPEILYFFSGKDRDIIGGFANSGHFTEIAQAPWETRQSIKPLYANVMNNRMGHQCALFQVVFTAGWRVSPDLEPGSYFESDGYRLVGVGPYDIGYLGFSKEDHHIELRFGEQMLAFSPWLCLSGEPCFSDINASVAMRTSLAGDYTAIREARDQARSGSPAKALVSYGEALASASDDPMRLYALADGARELREAGRPDLALALLPTDLTKTANPGTLMFQKAELLSLLEKPADAARLFLQTRDAPSLQTWYSLPGYVRSRILMGADTLTLYRECQRFFPQQADYPTTHAWCLIPGLLKGTLAQSEKDLAREAPPAPKNSFQKDVLFREEAEFWQALFDLEMGRPVSAWPNENAPETQDEPALKLKIEFLKAWRMHKEGKKQEALPLLEKVRKDLQEAAKSEPEALLPWKVCDLKMKTIQNGHASSQGL